MKGVVVILLNTLFKTNRKNSMDGDTKYSRAIKTPQYVPSNIKPKLFELYDNSKYIELVRNINMSDIDDDVKEFLKYAATRHIKFNYSKIADFYAHSDKDVQELFEQSALVIIDIDNAIQEGYVNLSRKMKELVDEQKQIEGK